MVANLKLPTLGIPPPEGGGGCHGFPFRDVRVEHGTIPVDVIEAYLDSHSPVEYDASGLVETVGDRARNTPADGPYPYIQPAVDHADGTEYIETGMIPGRFDHPVPRRPERDQPGSDT